MKSRYKKIKTYDINQLLSVVELFLWIYTLEDSNG